jgi:hypothetical protein
MITYYSFRKLQAHFGFDISIIEIEAIAALDPAPIRHYCACIPIIQFWFSVDLLNPSPDTKGITLSQDRFISKKPQSKKIDCPLCDQEYLPVTFKQQMQFRQICSDIYPDLV